MTIHLTVPLTTKATGNSIEGHGSVFGNVDLGGDIVLPGAFKRSLAEHKSSGTMPAMLWQHDPRQVPGAWRQASEDDTGLMLVGEFADTQLGRETRTLTKMGAVNGLSIGIMLKDFDFDSDGSRLIKEAELWETSIVTFPMNPKAQVEAIKSTMDPRSLEKRLREAGCSRKESRSILHDVYGVTPGDGQCDAGEALIKQMLSATDEHQFRKHMGAIFNG